MTFSLSYQKCELSSLDNSDKNLIIRASVLRSQCQLSLGSTEDPLQRQEKAIPCSFTDKKLWLTLLISIYKRESGKPLGGGKGCVGWSSRMKRRSNPTPRPGPCYLPLPTSTTCVPVPFPCPMLMQLLSVVWENGAWGEGLQASHPWCHVGLRYKGCIWAGRGLASSTTAIVLAWQHSYRCGLFSATNEKNCFKAPCHPPISLLRDSAYF